MLRSVAALSLCALLATVGGCSKAANDSAGPTSQASPFFAEHVTDLVVGDTSLFLLTHGALVSVPKTGIDAITIATRVEPTYGVTWHPLARGGDYVVAALDVRGPVVVVDQRTSKVVATWQPPADFAREPWAIGCVASDGERVFVGLQDADDVASVVALPAATLSGPPETVVRLAGVGDPSARELFGVSEVVADGASIYLHVDRFTQACPDCGLVGAGSILRRVTAGASTDLFDGPTIHRIALADDAVWLLHGEGQATRIPKGGGAAEDVESSLQVDLLATSRGSAFVSPNGAAIRRVGSDETIPLRPSASASALAVDDDFVYAAVNVTDVSCSGEGKAVVCTSRSVIDGVDRMPRPAR